MMKLHSGLNLLNGVPVLAEDAILVVGCVRDEWLRLPWFLQHHRNLGVTRFLIIDNDSTDGTTEYLQSQPDVSIFHTKASYAASNCGVAWVNAVLNAYAINHWTLVLDADELFVYPNCETLSLRRLTRYLDGLGAQSMAAPLLDMYSKSAIGDTNYTAGRPFLETCPYFDGDSYDSVRLGEARLEVRSRGGARHRLFWQGRHRSHPSPFLSKIPLIKWRPDLMLEASTHILRGAKLAAATGVLLHFKFMQDFAERTRHEARRKEHFAEARQYAAYSEVMSAEPSLGALYEGSVRYEDSRQLVRLGLMKMSEQYPED